MTRHRGRHRPFARLHGIWPKHCGCWNCTNYPIIFGDAPYSLFDMHPVRTVAPR